MQYEGISKNHLKQLNRTHLLRLVFHEGPISRVDLAKKLHLTRSGVTSIVNEMMTEGILEEVGQVYFDEDRMQPRGRRKMLLDLNVTQHFAMGVYLDETQMFLGISTLRLNILEQRQEACSRTMSVAALSKAIVGTAKSALQNCCLQVRQFVGIGVSIAPKLYDLWGEKMCTALQTQLQTALGIKAFVEPAMKQISRAGFRTGMDLCHPRNQALVSCDGHGSLWLMTQQGTVGLDSVILCADAEKGEVAQLLSQKALAAMIAPFFSKEQTPALWRALDGRLMRVTPEAVASVTEKTPALSEIAETYFRRLLALMGNLFALYQPDDLVMFGIGVGEHSLQRMRACAKANGKANLAEALLYEPIEREAQFLYGCMTAIAFGFLTLG